MAVLTKSEATRRGRHLRLVTRDDRRPELALDDPTPGRRDLDAVVDRFASLLPDHVDAVGAFSLGSV
jgi:hypothetical protein